MYKKLWIILGGLLFTLNFSFGQKFWTPVKGQVLPTKGERVLIPNTFQGFSMDQNKLKAFLSRLPNQPDNAPIIYLPNPEGKSTAFKIWETSMMPAALQAQFPEIRTYTATEVGRPYVSAKIDYTTFGLHAMVYDNDNTWFIEPYSNKPDGYYMSFYKKDGAGKSVQSMVCELDGDNSKELGLNGLPISITSEESGAIQQRSSQNLKRTYRLALSCTGEYAQAIDGSNPSQSNVFSAMTTSMNRVNGILEREINVTLVFIPNETDLIYLNPNTDPFTANNNGQQLLGQNQQNTNSVIGSSNYDMGHIFSTGGGGIAYLGGICNNSRKAMGVTGMANPIGDAFDVDYVAHEMGHQFGANHSFNDCNGNENQSTAYEPGSGSTIMCYAGICGGQNLQDHSNDYYHAISLTEMSNFIQGPGNSCAVSDSIQVHIPEFSSIDTTYYVPALTPFVLTGPTATGVDSGDSVSYCWEEWDLGNFKQSEIGSSNFTSGPTFRSYSPKVNDSTRYFPDLEGLLLESFDPKGDRLPAVNRTLKFKLTVRNIKDGWGSFKISDENLKVRVINTGEAFEVTEPNDPGSSFNTGDSMTVKWNPAGTDTGLINCPTVDILLSLDGGHTYTEVLATDVPNNGEATVILPYVQTFLGRIMVKGHNHIFFDINDYNFTIETAVGIAGVEENSGLNIYPNPATNVIYIQNLNPQPFQVKLVDQLGRILWAGDLDQDLQIPVAHLAKGMYFIQSYSPKAMKSFVNKVILQ